MPPDGYRTMTLPENLIDALDATAHEGETRADVIRRLLADHDEQALPEDGEGREDALAERLTRVEERLDHLPDLIAEEIERRTRQ